MGGGVVGRLASPSKSTPAQSCSLPTSHECSPPTCHAPARCTLAAGSVGVEEQ